LLVKARDVDKDLSRGSFPSFWLPGNSKALGPVTKLGGRDLFLLPDLSGVKLYRIKMK